jgi:precorrin-6B methylase 2
MTTLRKLAKRYLPIRLVRALETPLSFDQQFDIYLRNLTNVLADDANMTVQAGPFNKMKLTDHWGPLGAKLLGLYECELWSVIENAVQMSPDVIINVGCAEGYYAVGLARLVPSARVYAFDLNKAAQDRCHELAVVNGVAERVCVGEKCTSRIIQYLVKDAKRPLIIIDCEGGEREILLTDKVELFSYSNVIVECHDFIDRTITPRLVHTFSKTHFIMRIEQSSRNPHSIPILKDWSERDRWIVVMEGRGEPMHWLSMVPMLDRSVG